MLNRFFFIIVLLITTAFSSVRVTYSKNPMQNEAFMFKIEVSGENIKFPLIKEIDGNLVQEVSSSSSTNIVNSNITKTISKVYSFYPKKDFILPQLEFEIDGKKEIIKAKKIVLNTPIKTKSQNFDLDIKSSKNELYVGESFILNVTFKYSKHLQIIDLSFVQPNFDGFWFKQLSNSKKYQSGDFIINELSFLMTPLKSGKLKINPLTIVASIMDTNSSNNFSLFSDITKNIKIYSNDIMLEVKALPQDVKLIGDFKISSSIDKKEINLGESISYKIKIEGTGNIDDIPDLKLDLKDVTIYENKPLIKKQIVDGNIQGTYEKVFSLLPNKSIDILPISIKYLDKNTLKIQELLTSEYKIKVNKNQEAKQTQIKLEKQTKAPNEVKVFENSSIKDKIIYFSLGIFTTLIFFVLYFYLKGKKRDKQVYNTPLLKKIKQAQTKQELLKVLAVYFGLNKALDELILKLEKEENISVLKKQIIKKIRELKL